MRFSTVKYLSRLAFNMLTNCLEKVTTNMPTNNIKSLSTHAWRVNQCFSCLYFMLLTYTYAFLYICPMYSKSTLPVGLPYWTFSTYPCILLTNHKNVLCPPCPSPCPAEITACTCSVPTVQANVRFATATELINSPRMEAQLLHPFSTFPDISSH